MDRAREANVRGAQILLPCTDLHATTAFFADLGFRLDAVHPADDPSVAVMSGHGLHVRFQRGLEASPGVLRLLCAEPAAIADGATELTAPNGTRIQLVPADPPPVLPPLRPSFVLTRMRDDATWVQGRAGMRYRDLIPDRQGGRFVASHIRIEEGGPVPDYVHFHRVAFQMIYCARGWVRVVYEDQGPPFVLREGDCVLQPPTIRHRVLECSPGLEVIEIGSPADHETLADHDLALPTPTVILAREYGGQRFVRHQAAAAAWEPWRADGFEARDFGIAAATNGAAGARVVRARAARSCPAWEHDAELLFVYVLHGAATLQCDDRPGEAVGEGDAFVVPAGLRHSLEACSADLELLEVTLPASVRVTLRDVVDADYPVFFEHRRDEASSRMAAFGARDPDAGTFAARMRKAREDGSTHQKAILVDGQVVGFIATWLLEGEPQVTYWIARTHWGRGIATAALARLLELVTTRPLYASAARDNLGSLRVLEKCGFRVRGAEKAYATARGEDVEEVFLVLE